MYCGGPFPLQCQALLWWWLHWHIDVNSLLCGFTVERECWLSCNLSTPLCTPRSLLANNADVCVRVPVCVFSLMKATDPQRPFACSRQSLNQSLSWLRLCAGFLLSLAYIKKSFEGCLCCSHMSDCHWAAASVLVLSPDIKVTQRQRCSKRKEERW